jgi:imidazolonepropionase-like amidohydrolase
MTVASSYRPGVRRSLCVPLAFLLACAGREVPTPAVSDARPADVWIRGVTLISPERARPLTGAHVHLRGGRIAWVGSARPPGLPAGATEIDGTGRYLVPGLIDAHVHLAEVPGVNREQLAAAPALAEAYFRQLPRSYLYFGFTAVVDLAVIDRERVEAVRRAPLAPAVFDCGPPLPIANGYPMSFLPPPARFAVFSNFLYDPRQAAAIPPAYSPAEHTPAAAVARVASAGGICVKTAFESGFGADTGKLPTPTVQLISEVVAAGHARRLPVLLHANSIAAHRFAVDTKVDVVVHGLWNWDVPGSPGALPPSVSQILDDEIRAGIGMMPTVRVLGGLEDLFNSEFLADPQLARALPPDLLAWYRTESARWFANELGKGFEGLPPERVRQLFRGAKEGGRAAAAYFVDHGGRLLFGSDTPSAPTYANPPGYNGYLELRELESAGISPRQILEAATRANAAAFGLARDFGTVEPGKRASLLLLRSDPLVSVAAFDTIELVIVDGRVVPRSDLAAR